MFFSILNIGAEAVGKGAGQAPAGLKKSAISQPIAGFRLGHVVSNWPAVNLETGNPFPRIAGLHAGTVTKANGATVGLGRIGAVAAVAHCWWLVVGLEGDGKGVAGPHGPGWNGVKT